MKKKGYFKLSTRTLLTEKQKCETLALIDQGAEHLSMMIDQFDFRKISSGKNNRRVTYSGGNQLRYIRRWVRLIKGYTQPKHLYKQHRRDEITRRARLIASDTGADFQQVKEKFFALMSEYVGSDN